jgi:multidrug efflux system membrane fusion protein
VPVSYRSFLAVLSALCLLTLTACNKQEAKAPAAAMGMPVVPVSAARATQESVPTELRVVGTVEASAIVQVKSQIAGELLTVGFTEGQNVTKGQTLFEVDPRPYEEALRQAGANVARDRAQIGQLEATLARDAAQAQYNKTDADRYAELLRAGVVSKSQSDQAKTSADVARESERATKAGLESAKAALESDVAMVATAKLNLSYCKIVAPLSGRTGNLLVHPGNLVKVNDVPLVVIHQVAPIFVNFNVPEQHLAAIRRLGANRKLMVRVFPQDSPERGSTGTLSVIDNTVDTATGTIHLKATFENSDSVLWPGQFVTAVLTLDTISGATVVPTEAVQAGQQGQYMYVIKPNNTVEMRVVKVGRSVGKRTVIEQGIAPGENVVTDGHLRLFPGAQVTLVDAGKTEAGKS